MTPSESADRSLYEAARRRKGVRLTADEVDSLVFQDNAVAMRISQTIGRLAGKEDGVDGIVFLGRMSPWETIIRKMRHKQLKENRS